MNQKTVAAQKKKPQNDCIRIEDIAYSDSDTVPEHSGRDGINSNESLYEGSHILLIRSPEQYSEKDKENRLEMLNQEAKQLKKPLKLFKLFTAPHQNCILLANSIGKSIFGSEKVQLHLSYDFHTNGVGTTDGKHLKLDHVVFKKIGTFSDREKHISETSEDLSKRLENGIKELLTISQCLILICGSTVFDSISELFLKNNRKKVSNMNNSNFEHFWKNKSDWERVETTINKNK